jgi:hypothetical protein
MRFAPTAVLSAHEIHLPALRHPHRRFADDEGKGNLVSPTLSKNPRGSIADMNAGRPGGVVGEGPLWSSEN